MYTQNITAAKDIQSVSQLVDSSKGKLIELIVDAVPTMMLTLRTNGWDLDPALVGLTSIKISISPYSQTIKSR